ncbi:hypothetical protein ACFL9T_09030 [Thermodesulfobacteriota bacterium]
MPKKRWLFWLMIAFWGITGFYICGYLSGPVWAQTERDPSDIKVQKIAVMPFLKGFYGTKISETLDTPLYQASFNPDNISADADQILRKYIHQALGNRLGEKVIPLIDNIKAYDQLPKDGIKDTPRTLAIKLGKALGANLIMGGYVWRYKERIGGSYGVESPASVAFGIYLLHMASGKRVLNAKFDETQKSLSENLLSAKAFFQRKGKWLTANELAQYGVNEIFKKFPLH